VRIQVDDIDYRIDGDEDSGEVTIQPDGRCHYVGRRGKLNTEHTVTVTASGYKPFVTRVFVKAGSCGPSESQSVEARLEKE
jgi:hypothetical protein